MRTAFMALVIGLVGVAPRLGSAEEAQAPVPQLKLAPSADLSVQQPAGVDTLLLDEKTPLPARDPAFEALVQKRRTYLSLHQAVGLTTWGLMAATVIVGQLNYNDMYGPHAKNTLDYREPHATLAGATAATYTMTGILALQAPSPYPKKARLDTATIHKASMAVTTLGVAAQVVLGWLTRYTPSGLDKPGLAKAHQAVGYATFGAMTIGAVTLVF